MATSTSYTFAPHRNRKTPPLPSLPRSLPAARGDAISSEPGWHRYPVLGKLVCVVLPVETLVLQLGGTQACRNAMTSSEERTSAECRGLPHREDTGGLRQ